MPTADNDSCYRHYEEILRFARDKLRNPTFISHEIASPTSSAGSQWRFHTVIARERSGRSNLIFISHGIASLRLQWRFKTEFAM